MHDKDGKRWRQPNEAKTRQGRGGKKIEVRYADAKEGRTRRRKR